MKSVNGFRRRQRRRTLPSRRTELLAAFDRSGLSAAAFARQHGIGYSTFCGWRHRRAQNKSSPAFVEVELPAPAAPVELLVELGAQIRLRVSSAAQMELAAGLLHRLKTLTAC